MYRLRVDIHRWVLALSLSVNQCNIPLFCWKSGDRGLMEGNLICMLTAKHDIDSEILEMTGIVQQYTMKPTKPKELSALVEE